MVKVKELNLRTGIQACTLNNSIVIKHLKSFHKDWVFGILLDELVLFHTTDVNSVRGAQIYVLVRKGG